MTVVLSGIFLTTPLPPPILTLFPIFKCPEIPTWPPIITLFPIIVLPAMPDWAAIIQLLPICTLWAICTRLSILTLFPIIVFFNEPLAIDVLQPILTFSPICTSPICLISVNLLSIAKPKPSLPITAPDWIKHFLPILQLVILQLLSITTSDEIYDRSGLANL